MRALYTNFGYNNNYTGDTISSFVADENINFVYSLKRDKSLQ